jgi:hypothetical protein
MTVSQPRLGGCAQQGLLGVRSGVASNGSTVYNLRTVCQLIYFPPSIFDSPYFSTCLHPVKWFKKHCVFFIHALL